MRQAEQGRTVRLMFQDEGRFGLLGTPRRCWAPRSTRPVVGARLERKYIYAFSAVSPHDGVMDSLVLPWVNAETMSMFLAEVAQRHADDSSSWSWTKQGGIWPVNWWCQPTCTSSTCRPTARNSTQPTTYGRQCAKSALPTMSSRTSMLSKLHLPKGSWRSNQTPPEHSQ